MFQVTRRSDNSYTANDAGDRTYEILERGGKHADAVQALVECDARNLLDVPEGSARQWQVESDELGAQELREVLDTAAVEVDAEMVAHALVASFGVSEAEAERLVH